MRNRLLPKAFCPQSGEQQFSEGLHAIQKVKTQSGRLRFTDKVGERKPKADLHLSVFGQKALGCESPIKSRIACGGQQAETLPWRLIARVFHATDFPLGRLRESFEPQTSRWGDCASFSSHRLPGGAIVQDNRSPRNLFVGTIFQSSSPASVKNSHLCHPEI